MWAAEGAVGIYSFRRKWCACYVVRYILNLENPEVKLTFYYSPLSGSFSSSHRNGGLRSQRAKLWWQNSFELKRLRLVLPSDALRECHWTIASCVHKSPVLKPLLSLLEACQWCICLLQTGTGLQSDPTMLTGPESHSETGPWVIHHGTRNVGSLTVVSSAD